MSTGKSMADFLPDIEGWIERTKEEYSAVSVSVESLGFAALERFYPLRLLRETRIVETRQPFPYPPLAALGFPELAYWDSVDLAGINYAGLIFVKEGRATPSLLFHELVHVVQGETIGRGNYLLAYAASLAADSYDGNPFEDTAYRLQREFEDGSLGGDIVPVIEREARVSYARITGAYGSPA